ncbi:MAG: PHP domain-containing protein [Verrucomicrobia bacterium]|nr:PHP domain-containing protein [Verrucomicrobiota bacterium]
MKRPKHFISLFVFIAVFGNLFAASDKFPPGGSVVESDYHHLGREKLEQPWPEVPAKPKAEKLKVRFDSKPNDTEWVLAIRQRDVSERCLLLLNGKEIAALKHNQDPDLFFYAVPPGALVKGENILAINPTKPRDNMVVGPIHLYERTLRDLRQLQPVKLTITDADTGKPVPARVTITNLKGDLVEIFDGASDYTAVRLGTICTLGTEAGFDLPEGDYLFCATRGMEWSRGELKVSISKKAPTKVALKIRREVDTTGFIAADTHIHTLTHSGHGDASVAERVVTLASEGVELAIATDHNHNTDYHPHQKKLSEEKFFTAVTGNEISSAIGHINAFPLDPKDSVPSHKLEDWVQLVDGIRAKGAKVVILNHPRGNVFSRYVYTPFGLNRASGEFVKSSSFPFDAVELTNPGGAFDPIYLLRDWFALLNHGEKVTAVSASDSHTVADPVGWWRSFVPSKTDDPAKIDVDDACNRFLAGETSISLGIFTDIRVNDTYKMGQTCSPKSGHANVRLRVASPSWVTPTRALVFINGQQVAEKAVPANENGPTDLWLDFSVALPKHDAHLVGVIIGDGVDHPSVGVKGKNTRFTLAATNPVYLDIDGNGKYESPRETARQILSGAGNELSQKWKSIMAADDIIAIQMVSLLRQQTTVELRPTLDKLIREAATQRPLFAEYAQYALPIDKNETAGGQ